MELTPQAIPDRFTRAIPRGFRLVRRLGHEFLLVESVFCPEGHNLVVDSVRIHNEASIKLKLVVGGQAGLVFVDAFWGSHAKLFSFVPVAAGAGPALVEGRCPYCDAPMNERYPCPIEGCGSEDTIRLVLPGGKNTIRVCARLGCPGHLLDIADIPQEVVRTVSGINYFGAGGEDVLGSI
jgi:hypothetical protein